MNPHFDFSPVPLSYVGALRGIRPRAPGENFAYAEIACSDPERLVCLAASNPEGHFYGLVSQISDRSEGEKLAAARQVSNVTFIAGRPSDCLALARKGSSPLPALQYICCDERSGRLPADEHTALFDLAEMLLQPGGLFGYGYRAYEGDDGSLRFLVREVAPEVDVPQAKEFLDEIKKLGIFYLAEHPEAAAKLESAMAAGVPDRFFSDYDKGEARSGSFDTIVALRPRGFTYLGDADIRSNYIEMAAPSSSHQVILDCRDNPLYEAVKDFALNRRERRDIWCRQPAPTTTNPTELFGNFVYGITMSRSEVPAQVKTNGKPVDLSGELFDKLIDLMTLIPLSIGDFLAHGEGKNFVPADVIGAIQILIACGIARPMRGHYRAKTGAGIAQPRFAGAFNQYVDKTPVTGGEVWLSSPMAGTAVSVSAREALVMQALNRAGLANSSSALFTELQRLAKDPASAARVMNAAPTPELASNMIKDTVSQSIVQWYAYGLLAAA